MPYSVDGRVGGHGRDEAAHGVADNDVAGLDHLDDCVAVLGEGWVLADPRTVSGQVDGYLQALVAECKKYPTDFFSKAAVSEIVLCGTLEMGRAPIAGIYFEQQKQLYVKFVILY